MSSDYDMLEQELYEANNKILVLEQKLKQNETMRLVPKKVPNDVEEVLGTYIHMGGDIADYDVQRIWEQILEASE